MRIVLLSTGSRGDVQPYLALSVGLRKAGHQVRLASHSDFGAMVREHGLDFFAIAGDSRALHETLEGRKMLAAKGNPFTFMRQFAEMRKPIMRDLMARCLAASRAADLILVSTTGFLPGISVAEKLQKPFLPVHFVPNGPNFSQAHCLLPELPGWLPGRRLYNWLSYLVVGEYFWQLLGSVVNDARQEVLGLPAFPFLGPPLRLFEQLPVLYGYSPLIVPRPPDLGSQHAVTGHWFLDRPRRWRPPAGLIDFLEAGPPPVCIGFGSMQCGRAEEMTDLVTRALSQSGQRGILLTGWGGLGRIENSERCFAVESIPHDWLFPRVTAVVHHGGAGTTAAGLRAGVPTLVVPFMADQPFWGRRVAALGVGPDPIPRHQLSVKRLARAILQMVGDSDMRARAAELGGKLRVEDGVGTAVEAFEAFVPALMGQETAPRHVKQPALTYALRRTRPLLPAPEAGRV